MADDKREEGERKKSDHNSALREKRRRTYRGRECPSRILRGADKRGVTNEFHGNENNWKLKITNGNPVEKIFIGNIIVFKRNELRSYVFRGGTKQSFD